MDNTYRVLNVADGREKYSTNENGGRSICNSIEADIVSAIVKILVNVPAMKKKSIGVITYYQKQREIIEGQIIAKYDIANTNFYLY